VLVAAALAGGALLAGQLPDVRPECPGTFSFGAHGDAPYGKTDQLHYPLVLRDMNAHGLSFVIHVGDILGSPCTDERYRTMLDWWSGLRHPLIYTPGDNEWTDCWGERRGGFVPRERLARLRQLFFAQPGRSLGGPALAVVSQAGDPAFAEFVENARWSHQGVIFATVHLVGSENGRYPFPGQVAADLDEVERRTEAAAAWLREAFAEAHATRAVAVVVSFHGFPFFEQPPEDERRRAFEPFLLALEEEVERFARPVLVIHGDEHRYMFDHPLVRRTTGRRLENFTRLQVPGSPDVGWVRVVVTPGSPTPFDVEERVVPSWRFW
jgi:hypothetical protein